VLYMLLVVVHVTVCLALILVVLLQVGKGQSIGAAFGGAGSSQTFFGSRGPATFLSRLTTVSAAVFMLTSLSLAYISANGGQGSTITHKAPPPVTDTAPAPVTIPAPGTAPAPTPGTESAPSEEAPAPPAEQPKQGQ
jgi:preprotein translocase subunit SecG